MTTSTFTVEKEEAGQRLDVFLAEKTELTRSRIKGLSDEGNVTVNGKTVKAGCTLKRGDVVAISVPDPVKPHAEPVDLPIEILYEDDDLAVINKPQGLTVHAGNGTGKETLVNALLFRLDSLSGVGGVLRPGIVHRIDKNTSGVLLIAKNDAAHVELSRQIQEKTCRRKYYALLEGEVKQLSGRIDNYLCRDEKRRTLYTVSKSGRGRRAITDYRVVARFDGYTLAEFSLLTGRTHQIRVHAKFMGHPVVGDPEYGFQKQKFHLNGQLLHAHEITFTHPKTGVRMAVSAPLPVYFTEILQKLRGARYLAGFALETQPSVRAVEEESQNATEKAQKYCRGDHRSPA